MVNSWPDGIRRALHQNEHEFWNSFNFPGTRQICVLCDEPTERCEEDSIYLADETGPVCVECYKKSDEYKE